MEKILNNMPINLALAKVERKKMWHTCEDYGLRYDRCHYCGTLGMVCEVYYQCEDCRLKSTYQNKVGE